MKPQPAITPARDYSARTRRRHSRLKRYALAAFIILASLAFWGGVISTL